LIVPATILCSSCSEEPPREEQVRPVRAIRLGDASEFSGRQFPGRAVAVSQADMSFRVPGTLMSLPARIGDQVTEGEVIARLDPRDFEVRVRGGEAAVARAQSELARAREEFGRATTAFERGAVTEIEIVRFREAMNIAAATVEAIEADLQSARDGLADTSLRAPFDGEIVARFVENFQDVQARQPVLRIVDDRRINFTVYIPESMITVLPYVEEIRCEFESFPGREIVAEIDEVGREADPITRTFPVTLIMTQPEGVRILAGMSGRAWVSRVRATENDPDWFDIPPSAVIEDATGARFVWLVDPSSGMVRQRAVTTGALSPAGLAVRGLKKGEVVATGGASFLREGQQVRLIKDEQAIVVGSYAE
jgi:RND family efflux transporter MFP subunit